MTVTAPPDALSDAARRFLDGPEELLIGGEWKPAADGRTFESVDPATGEAIAVVAQAGAAGRRRARCRRRAPRSRTAARGASCRRPRAGSC